MRLASLMLVLALLPQDDSAVEWVGKLEKGAPAERWKAVEALAVMGEKAKPALEKSEEKWWAGVALAEIAARAEGRGGGPVLVTLDAKDRELRDAIQDLASQAKIRLRPDSLPAENRKVTLKLEQATWFDALGELARAADVDVGRERARGATFAVQAGPGKTPRACLGAFETSVSALVFTTRNTFESEPYTVLTVRLRMRGDPTSPVLDVPTQAKAVEARDDTGRDLLIRGGHTTGHVSVRTSEEETKDSELSLEAPAKEAKSIALLRGEATVTVMKKQETVRFDDVLKASNVVKTLGELTVTLVSAKEKGEEYEVEIKMTSKKSQSNWPNTQELKLCDSGGQEYQTWGTSASWGGTSFNATIHYRNPGGLGPPAALQFDLVTETYKRRVFFEFKDVPLK